MIRSLILFYLNIKPTHGYEIQQFIQMAYIEQWAKIQSGSIYYALSKLLKEEDICIYKKEYAGTRERLVYAITDKGKKTMTKELKKEMAVPICDIGSAKFILFPMILGLPNDAIREITEKHILNLEEKKENWEKWKAVKGQANIGKLNEMSFEMSIHSLQDQIAWHKELLQNLEEYKKDMSSIIEVIQKFSSEESEV